MDILCATQTKIDHPRRHSRFTEPIYKEERTKISTIGIGCEGNWLIQTYNSPAREDEWVSYIYGELDETSLYVMRRHGDLAPIYGEAPAAMTASRAYAEKHLAVVAEHMTGKDFVVGDQLGLADIMLVSCLDWAVHYDFELEASLLRYRDLHHSRQAYRRAFDVNYRASS